MSCNHITGCGYSHAKTYRPLLHMKRKLTNELSFDIKYVFMYRKTHSLKTNNLVWFVFQQLTSCNNWEGPAFFDACNYFEYHQN